MRKVAWKVREAVRRGKARAALFLVRARYLGWWAVTKPVARCEVCGRAYRVLWWYVGDHGHWPY